MKKQIAAKNATKKRVRTKKLAAYSLTFEAIEAVQREARRLAAVRDERVSASSLVEELIQKHVVLKRQRRGL